METIIKSIKELGEKLLDKLPGMAWTLLQILLALLVAWLGYRILKRMIVGFLHRLNNT